ncbi:MAG: LysM peptidoglycan-binding domain-containing protein [Anaerolineales bacterium]|nr:LysM peptidoglycan-binding domain-containing protein [Anaerolineales bacterium]
MSRKTLLYVVVLGLFLLATFANATQAQAGGYCSQYYVVQWGDTLGGIAALCGTTVAALYAANPGLSGYLYAGQTIVIPVGGCYACPLPAPSGAYIVQWGDTFAGIAQKFGVSVSALWSANPQISNVNYIYVGQIVYVPGYAPIVITPVETDPPPLSYGSVPAGSDFGKVYLSNRANADVYVSLQGTAADGTRVIREYPVNGNSNAKIPAGWYLYVAWVGGQKYEGTFRLVAGEDVAIVFYKDKVTVQ